MSALAIAGLLAATGAIASSPIRLATASGATLFTDGFESGSFSAWSSAPVVSGDGTATVQSNVVRSGAFAARLSESTSSTSGSYIRQSLSPSRTELRVTAQLDVLAEGLSGSSVPLIRLFTGTGARLVSVYRQNATGGKLYVQHSGLFIATTGTLALATWASIDLHVIVSGSTSTVEVRLNDVPIYQTTTAALGTDPILSVQLGNEVKAQAFTLAADDVVVTDGGSPPPSGSPSPSASPSSSSSPTGIRHVIWVLFENKEVTAITPSSAPYFSSFASTYANFTNFYARFHPSLPNYLASWSGSNQGITGDTDPNLAADNLASQLTAAGKQWRSFAQNYNGTSSFCNKAISIAGTTADGPGVIGDYVRRHNPPMEFTNVSGTLAECAKIQPLASFDPQVDMSLVIPNVLNDMHDGTITQGDQFLQAFVPTVTSSPDWAHTLLVVTFDEGTTTAGGGGHVYTAAAAPWLSHVTISPEYDHYNLLRTAEDIFGVPALGLAATAPPISELYPAGGGGSPPPSPSASPSPGGTLLSDDFESGSLGSWSVKTSGDGTAAAQSAIVRTGASAARLTASATANSAAYARASLGGARPRLLATEDVRVATEGAANGNVPLMRLFDASGTRILSVFRQNQSSNRVYVAYGGANILTSGNLALGTWAGLSVHLIENGSASTVEVRLNGTLIYQTTTATLSGGIATIQLGNDTKKQAFDLAVDNVLVRDE
jgi:hypothetical protein